MGSKRCLAYDDIDIKICKKCSRYNHDFNKCENNNCCLHCAEAHDKCPNQQKPEICANCLYFNQKFNKENDVNHKYNDTIKCTALKNIIKRKISSKDYPINPVFPKFLGEKIKKIDPSMN